MIRQTRVDVGAWCRRRCRTLTPLQGVNYETLQHHCAGVLFVRTFVVSVCVRCDAVRCGAGVMNGGVDRMHNVVACCFAARMMLMETIRCVHTFVCGECVRAFECVWFGFNMHRTYATEDDASLPGRMHL